MGWFHKTLTDMLVAIQQQKWQKVRLIAEQHQKPLSGHDFNEGLSQAAIHIQTYSEKMSNIVRIVGKPKKARTPVGFEETILEVSAKEAQEAIARFEKIIKKLVEKGKFEE